MRRVLLGLLALLTTWLWFGIPATAALLSAAPLVNTHVPHRVRPRRW